MARRRLDESLLLEGELLSSRERLTVTLAGESSAFRFGGMLAGSLCPVKGLPVLQNSKLRTSRPATLIAEDQN